jgi:exoribonuclease R
LEFVPTNTALPYASVVDNAESKRELDKAIHRENDGLGLFSASYIGAYARKSPLEKHACQIKQYLGRSGHLGAQRQALLAQIDAERLGAQRQALLGEIDSERRALADSAGADLMQFPDKVNQEVAQYENWRVSDLEADVKDRTDLRLKRIFTIDPLSSRDLDDAVSIEQVFDTQGQHTGEYDCGVHIADVSHFMKPETALDAEAALRSTSIYQVNCVIPMLPRVLCETVCSLNPGVDRFAVSVLFRLDAKGKEVGKPKFCRSIIRSCVKLDYASALAMIDTPGTENEVAQRVQHVQMDSKCIHTLEEVVADVRMLEQLTRNFPSSEEGANSICVTLGQHVQGGGAEAGDQMHVQVIPDGEGASGQALTLRLQMPSKSKQLIAKLMIFANRLVAERICEFHPEHAVLRAQPPRQSLALAIDALRKFGTAIKTKLLKGIAALDVETIADELEKDPTPKTVRDSLSKLNALETIANQLEEDPTSKSVPGAFLKRNKYDVSAPPDYLRTAIKMLDTKSNPPRARYICLRNRGMDIKRFSEVRHLNLELARYTHFSSPIRRYVDVLVHRLLMNTFTVNSSTCLADALGDVDLESVLDLCNLNTRRAKDASLYSSDLHFCCFLQLAQNSNVYYFLPALIKNINGDKRQVTLESVLPEYIKKETMSFHEGFWGSLRPSEDKKGKDNKEKSVTIFDNNTQINQTYSENDKVWVKLISSFACGAPRVLMQVLPHIIGKTNPADDPGYFALDKISRRIP